MCRLRQLLRRSGTIPPTKLMDAEPVVSAPIDPKSRVSSLRLRQPKLVTFLTHGEVPLDNNRCEHSIRPFVVGRKGWLFSDTVKGAVASANLYSLVETAKADSIEPHAYLSVLFDRRASRKGNRRFRDTAAMEYQVNNAGRFDDVWIPAGLTP